MENVITLPFIDQFAKFKKLFILSYQLKGVYASFAV